MNDELKIANALVFRQGLFEKTNPIFEWAE